MIRNIVFDMGNVLLSYDPKPYVAREIPDPEAGRLLFDACFGGPEWKQLDAGAISEEEALLSMQSHIPQELRGPGALQCQRAFPRFGGTLFRSSPH